MAEATSTISEVLQSSREAFDDFSSAIDALSNDEITKANTIGSWSVRDVMAHIGGDELWMAGQLEALRFEQMPSELSCYGVEAPAVGDIELSTQDGRNAWQRERLLRSLSLDDVRRMAREAHARLLAVISAFDDAQLAEPLTIANLKTVGWIRKPKAGEQAWPLWQWLRGVTFQHYREHTEQIRAVR